MRQDEIVVEEDIAAGSGLVDTLVEYAACDLNAKTAARRLHLHANTAYYRLDRIAEKTGCDVRRFSDVVELLIAVRLLPGGGAANFVTGSRRILWFGH